MLDFNHIVHSGEMWADHKQPYLRGVRRKLDFVENLLPSAGPFRKKFYSLIAHFIFHLSGLFSSPNFEQESKSGTGKAAQCSLRVRSVKNSGSQWDHDTHQYQILSYVY